MNERIEREWSAIAKHFGTDQTTDLDPWDAFLSHMRILHGAAVASLQVEDVRWATVQTTTAAGKRRTHPIRFTLDTFELRLGELFDGLLKNHSWDSWFAALGLQHTEPEEYKSANTSNSDKPYALFLDLDTSTGNHKSEKLPSMTEALYIVDEFENALGAFHLVNATGGGLQCYLQLAEPLTDELLKLWKLVIKTYSTDSGFDIDNLSNRGSQLVRLSGSINGKDGYDNAPVKVAVLDESGSGLSIARATKLLMNFLTKLGYVAPVEDDDPRGGESLKPTTVPSRRSGATSPGDRLNAALSAIDLLRSLVPLQRHSTLGRWSYGESNDSHVQTDDKGHVAIHGQRLLRDLNNTFDGELESGQWFTSAHALANALYANAKFEGFGGRAYGLIATAIRNVENGGQSPAAVVQLMMANPSATNLERAIRTNR